MAIKQPALIAARDNRKKKKEKELLKPTTTKETVSKPKTITVKSNDKGKTYVDRSTISKKPTVQNTTQNRIVTNKDRLTSKSNFGGINNDIRTVKTTKKSKPKQNYSVGTYDIYKRDGRYYYNDGKEKEIDKNFVEKAIKEKKTGVIGNYDSKGQLRTTDSRGNVKAPEKNLLKNIARVGKGVKLGGEKGAISIASKELQDLRSDLDKGEKIKKPMDYLSQISNIIYNSDPRRGMGTAIKNAANNAKELWKDNEKKTLDKVVGTFSEAAHAGLTGERQGIKDATTLWGAVLPKDTDKKVEKLERKINEPINKKLEKFEEEKENYSNIVNRSADIGRTVGNMLPGIGASVITRNPDLGILATMASVRGQSTERAEKAGKDLDEAIKYGDLMSAIEGGTEYLSSGLKVFGKGPKGNWLKGGSESIDDVVMNAINAKVTNPALNFALKSGAGITGEQFEEVLSDILGTVVDIGTIDPNATYTLEDLKRTLLDTGLSTIAINALTGGYGSGAYNSNINDMNNFNIQQQQANEINQRVQSGEIDDIEGLALLDQVKDGTYQKNRNLEQIATQESQRLKQAAQQGIISQEEYTQGLQALTNTVNQTREEINTPQQETTNTQQESTQESTFNKATKGKNVKIVDNKPITTNKEAYNSKPKEGTIRLYTNTSAENIDSILKNGLDVSKAKQNEYEGNMTWFETRPDLKGYGGTTIAVDVPLNLNMDKVNDTQYTVYDNISPENITFVDRPVMNNYRTSDIEELLNKYGEEKTTKVFDRALENGKAFINKDEFNNIIKSINANNNVETNQKESTQKKKFNNELADFINSETDSSKAEMSDFFKDRTTDYDKNQGYVADGKLNVFRFKKGNNEAKLSITENENEIWIDELYIKNQKQGYGKEIVDAIKKYAYEKGKEIRTFKEVGSARKFWDKMFGEETSEGGFSHRYIKHKPEYWQNKIKDTQEQIERFSKWKENALEQGKEDLANNHQEGIDWAKKRLEEYKTEYEKSKQDVKTNNQQESTEDSTINNETKVKQVENKSDLKEVVDEDLYNVDIKDVENQIYRENYKLNEDVEDEDGPTGNYWDIDDTYFNLKDGNTLWIETPTEYGKLKNGKTNYNDEIHNKIKIFIEDTNGNIIEEKTLNNEKGEFTREDIINEIKSLTYDDSNKQAEGQIDMFGNVHVGKISNKLETNQVENISNNRYDSQVKVEKAADGTQYIDISSSINGIKSDGTKMTPREFFDSIVGSTIKFSQNDSAKIIDNLKGNGRTKSLFSELFKRRPVVFKNIDDIKKFNNDINYNILELLENSEKIKSETDKGKKHEEFGIEGFDTREVNLYDGDKAYRVEFSIAKLKSGEKIAYAKKYYELNQDLQGKIKDLESRGSNSSSTQGLSTNNIQQNQQNVNTGPEILDTMPVEKNTTIKSLKKGLDKFRQEITDRFAPVYDMARKMKNPTLYHEADAILKSDAMAQVDLGMNQVNLKGKPYKNFTDENGNKVSMSYERAYDLYDEIPVKAKNEYLVHWLNVDRLNQGVDQFGIPLQESLQKIQELENEYKNMGKWSENIYQFYRNLTQNMVDNGRVSQELADKWLKETPHFVHIERQVPNKGNQGVSVKNGRVDSDNLIRKVKGGNYPILPIKESTARYVQNSRRAFAYNQFGKEYARTIGYDAQGNNVSESTDIDEIFGFDPEFVNNDGKGNYTMKIYDKGVPVEIPISEDVYNSLSPKNIPRVGVLAEATNLYKDLLTNKNPFFGFLRNPIRDAGDMFLYSKHPLRKSLATYGKLFAGRTALRNRVITKDGVTAQDIVDFYNNTGNGAHSFYRNGQFESQKGGIRKGLDKALSPIEKGNDFMESLPRITEFWNTIQAEGYTIKDGELVPQQGKNPKKTADQVLAEASFYAADVTVNFKRGGRTSKAISQNGGIFFNPSVQGASKFVRNITEAVGDAKAGDFQAAKRLVARAAMMGVAPAILSAAMYGGDDDYEEMQDYQKDQYYLIRKGNGKWIRIPKGRALSLFESAARRGIDKTNGKEDAFKGYGQLVMNQIAPNNPLDNNIASPIFAAINNKSWSGNKIVSDSMAKRPVEEQFNEKTDELSKKLGKQLHISPMKINYVLDQYSGVLGDLILPQITPRSSNGTSNPIVSILKDNYTFDAANSNKSVGNFYDVKGKLNTKANSVNPTSEDKLKSQYMNKQSQKMYGLYTKKQKIQMDKSLSKKEKYEQSLEVQKEINKFAKKATENVKDIDIKGNTATIGGDLYYKNKNSKSGWSQESEKTTKTRKELGLSPEKYYYYKNDESYKTPDGYTRSITSGKNAKQTIAMVDAFNFDPSDYLKYKYKLSQIHGDKDSRGRTIRYSARNKKIKYLNSLPISAVEKAYLMKQNDKYYRSSDSSLKKAISNSNLSNKEKKEIYSY